MNLLGACVFPTRPFGKPVISASKAPTRVYEIFVKAVLLQTVWLSLDPPSRVIVELGKTTILTLISAAGVQASVIACKTISAVVAVSGVP